MHVLDMVERLLERGALGLLVGLGLLTCAAGSSRAEAPGEQQKVAARLVEHALDYEVDGQPAAKADMLAAALKTVPDFAPARWQSGFVKLDNRWVAVDEVPTATKNKKTLAAYRLARDKYPATAAGQLELADWCAAKHLPDQERAHLTKVLELETDHAVARERLGFRQVDGAWRSREEQEAADREQQANSTALRKWTARVERIRRGFDRKDPKQRESAAGLVREIDDASAIPALEQLLALHSEEAAGAVVACLTKLRDYQSTLALARQAVASPWQEVRETAAQSLSARSLESYVPALLNEMHSPIQSEMALVVNPDGRLFYRHSFEREGHQQREQRVANLEVDRVVLPGASGMETYLQAMWGIGQMAARRELDTQQQNQLTEQLNQRICWALSLATDSQLTSPQSAWQWWSDKNEVYTAGAKPVARSVSYDSVTLTEGPVYAAAMECLVAGTPVWTDLGSVPIEKVRVGDRVLAQDPANGELAYKPVLRTTVRPKDQLLKLEFDGDMLQSTGGHPFWVAGRGWLKARDLAPGMLVHGAGSPVALTAISQGPTEGTFNLIVADFHSYFVGEQKLLSHDNTPRRPTTGGLPGKKK